MDEDFYDGYDDDFDDDGPLDGGPADADAADVDARETDADDAPAVVRQRLPLEYCEAVLQVSGADLDPDEVTATLGCEPSEAHGTGEVLRGAHLTMEVLRGYWFLRSGTDERVSAAGQIDEILDRLTDDLAAWERLANRFALEMDLHVVVDDDIRTFQLDPATLARLGERRVQLLVHVYPD